MRVETDGGEVIDLGVTETTPTIGITDYSRRVTDDFGVTTVVPRGFARRMSVRLGVPFDQVDALQRRLADLRATPARWVADDRFDWLSARGFYKDFDLDLAVPPLSFCTLTVEGLAETEVVADPGGDPAPAGQPSTLQLLRPATVTDAALAASDVPENDGPEWSAGTPYPLGARVIEVATHRIYESAASANLGNDPAGTSGKWLDVGPTNRWAMFDQALGTATSAAGSIGVVLNASIDAVALLDVVGTTVRVQASGYDRTVPAAAGAITFLDVPAVDQVVVTVAGTGQVSVGTLLIGRMVALGVTEASPTAGITDYSRKEVDDFGEVTVVQRAWAKRMTARALIRSDALDIVAGRIAAVRTRPALWIGGSGLDSLTVYGFFKDFSIEVGETVSKLSLSVEGLSSAGKVEPFAPGGSVDWPNVGDPAGTKPADNADVTGDNIAKDTAAVGGRPTGTVLTQIDAAIADIDALIEQVATLDAGEAGSAILQAAEAARDAAVAARANSETARDQAQAARDASNAAAALAQQLALAAAQSTNDASGFATTAHGEATIATQKADEAGQQAAIATAKTDIAITKAGEAVVSTQAAALSEANALGFKTAAATSATVSAAASGASQLALAMTFPASYSPAAVSLDFGGTPDSMAPVPAGWGTDTYYLDLDQSTNSAQIALRGAVPVEDGKFYRVTARAQGISTSTYWPYCGFWAVFYDADFGYVTAGGPYAAFQADGDGETVDWTAQMTGPGGFNVAGARWVRFGLLINRYTPIDGRVIPTARTRVDQLYVRDVTEDHNAGVSAQASSVHAASAAASDTAAGQKAGAADSSAQLATTRAGEASVHRDAAAVSEQNAAGSVVQASDLVQLAASSETASAGHATAALTAAGTATTKAGESGVSAAAADQARLDAQAANGGAQTQAGIATERAAVADAAASAAVENRILTASYRDEAAIARDASQASAGVSQTASVAADGHRSAAETASVLTAQYRDQAQGFRDGAAGQVVAAQALVTEEANVRAGETYALGQRIGTTEASVGGLSARTGIVEQSVVDVTTQTAAARLSLVAVSPGGRAEFTLYSSSNGGAGWSLGGDGQIHGDLTVDGTIRTNALAANSVTQPVAAEATGALGISWTDDSEKYGIQVTLVQPTGAPVRIDFRYYISSGGQGSAPPLTAQVQRVAEDGSVFNISYAGYLGNILLDSPPAGAFVTYRFYFKHQYVGSGSGSTNIVYQQLFALELKR